jgi:hypothetical protein
LEESAWSRIAGRALVAGEHGEAASEIVVRGMELGVLEASVSTSRAA